MPEKSSRKVNISLFFYLLLAGLYLAGAIASVSLVNASLRRDAIKDAERLADVLLEKNLATHTYFTHTLQPPVYELHSRLADPDYFEPAWMSSAYAVRSMETIFQSIANENYYYKECAINARSAENEADEFEREFIGRLNADPDLERFTAVRELDGEPYFVVLRRGEVMQESCLRCHTTPDRVPSKLVEIYGDQRSFNRSLGEVISAVSIRIPLETSFAQANLVSFRLSALLLVLLVVIFLILLTFSRRLIFLPLERLNYKARLISSDPKQLGEQIPSPGGQELAELTTSFNIMSASLREHQDNLENQVQARTQGLEDLNEQLQKDIRARQEAEAKIEQLAYFDVLTGLPNRTLLDDRLHHALAQARRESRPLALLFVDLDDFKKINDTLGHQVGDRFLQRVAEMLQQGVRESDTLARFGGGRIHLLRFCCHAP